MIKVLSVENMRKSDAYTIENYISSKELMYKAGVGVFKSVKWKGSVAVVCGSGNNAGDGYVIASLLHENNIPCTIFLIKEKFSEDGKFYFDKCVEARIKVEICSEETTFENYDMIVDCMLGTGFRGDVRGLAGMIIHEINKSSAYVVSVDINSGLNGDSGMSSLCVESDLTVSIGDYKLGHFLNMAKDVIKNKVNCDIGIKPVDEPYYLIEKNDLKEIFKERKNYSNKGSYGYIALIGGCKKYSGAIRLAYMANAAMRSGAGVVKVGLPDSISSDVTSHILESTLYPLKDKNGEIEFDEKEIDGLIKGVKLVAFGMGVGLSDETYKVLKYILENYDGKLVVDADGLTMLSKMDENIFEKTKCKLILTPHIKEFSRLTGLTIDEVLENPLKIAMNYAREKGVILLLKGPSTIITNGGKAYITDRGCVGMATAGSGDVLSGIISAVCAYNDDLLLSTAGAAYINGRAGELAQKKINSISMIASDTVNNIAEAISEIIK